MDDETSIARLKQGDLAGLESLIDRYQVQAVHAAVLITRDRSLAEEVVQDAFLHAAEKIDQFDQSRPFKPWFLRSVVNSALKAAHRQGRNPSFDQSDEQASVLARWLIDPEPGPERQFETVEERLSVREALEALSPEQRAVVVMRYYLEMSETDMSTRLGRSLDTIKWKLRTARRKLRNLLDQKDISLIEIRRKS